MLSDLLPTMVDTDIHKANINVYTAFCQHSLQIATSGNCHLSNSTCLIYINSLFIHIFKPLPDDKF